MYLSVPEQGPSLMGEWGNPNIVESVLISGMQETCVRIRAVGTEATNGGP